MWKPFSPVLVRSATDDIEEVAPSVGTTEQRSITDGTVAPSIRDTTAQSLTSIEVSGGLTLVPSGITLPLTVRLEELLEDILPPSPGQSSPLLLAVVLRDKKSYSDEVDTLVTVLMTLINWERHRPAVTVILPAVTMILRAVTMILPAGKMIQLLSLILPAVTSPVLLYFYYSKMPSLATLGEIGVVLTPVVSP